MSTAKTLSTLAAALAVLAICVALYQRHQNRQAAANLAAAKRDRGALIGQIAGAETQRLPNGYQNKQI